MRLHRAMRLLYVCLATIAASTSNCDKMHQAVHTVCTQHGDASDMCAFMRQQPLLQGCGQPGLLGQAAGSVSAKDKTNAASNGKILFYQRQLLLEQQKCPNSALKCPSSASAAGGKGKKGSSRGVKKPLVVDFQCRKAHSWMLLPGIVISRAPFTLSGTVIEPDAPKRGGTVFPFGCNRAPAFTLKCPKNKCLSDMAGHRGEEINCVKGYYMGGLNAINIQKNSEKRLSAFKSIKYVNPSLFSKGWDTEPAKACPDGVTSCMMPLNINHVTLKCTGKPCGFAMRICKKTMLIRTQHGCAWFTNGVEHKSTFLQVDGKCEGSTGCGNEWSYYLKYETPGTRQQVMCYVTKSTICEADRFRKNDRFVPTRYQCSVTKTAWCEALPHVKWGHRVPSTTFGPWNATLTCTGLLQQLTVVT